MSKNPLPITWLSMRDVGMILGMTEQGAQALVDDKQLRAFRQGGKMVTRPEDIGAYLVAVRIKTVPSLN
jgi:hypothetical protein